MPKIAFSLNVKNGENGKSVVTFASFFESVTKNAEGLQNHSTSSQEIRVVTDTEKAEKMLQSFQNIQLQFIAGDTVIP